MTSFKLFLTDFPKRGICSFWTASPETQKNIFFFELLLFINDRMKMAVHKLRDPLITPHTYSYGALIIEKLLTINALVSTSEIKPKLMRPNVIICSV
jgi:hypothetical protein